MVFDNLYIELQNLKLGELIKHQKGFAFKSFEYQPIGHPVVRISNFTDRSINMAECNYINPSKVEDYKDFALKAGDIVIGTVGSWPSNPDSVVGKVIKVPLEAEGALLNQNAVRLRTNGRIDQTFLFYRLKNTDFQNYIVAGAQGSANQASITLKSIFDFKFLLPDLIEQKAIAHILSSLDDKIELNREMNQTLEAIARAIFKSWFVDFDSVRAKMEGRQPAGMDAATAELFPSEFEESALGIVPKGWNHVPFEDLFLIPLRNGLTKPKAVRGIGTYMVNMGELFAYRRIGDIKMDRVPLTELEAEKNLLQTGDILFARQSLTLEGAGQSSIVIEAKEPRTFESHLIRCRLNPEKAASWFYFYYLQSNEGRGKIWSLVEQVAAAGIRGSDLAKLNVLAPSLKIQRCFSAIVESLEKKMASNDIECRTLASIRDMLLPKLLSGEIRVKEAEKVLEALT